ncbi:MAG: GNAT family N-acetyltransferase [Chloroflexi bacterium]|nr:GNAT family N-acetyltransferase [Chloroflexota bacterium]MBV9897512.1 GNAT family N-acetyltransferase [Chloroflexota bacterium]
MIVRRARYADAPQVAELLMQLGSRAVDADEAKRRLGRAREIVYVAEHGERLLGLAACKTDIYFGHNLPVTHLTALVTRAEARRSGVGKALVDAVLDFARENECFGVELTCGINPAREAAHQFYPSLGFVRSAYRYWYPLEVEERKAQ